MPPALAMAVATAPTTPWSGAVCSRIVIEYDDGVADMLLTLVRRRGPLGVAGPAGQHHHQQHERDHLGAADHGHQGGALDVVQPAGEDAADRAATAWNAANAPYAVPSRPIGDQVCHQRLDRGVLHAGRGAPQQDPGDRDATRSLNTSTGTAATTTGRRAACRATRS